VVLYIYIYMVLDNQCLLKYKIIINSKYEPKFHGYKIRYLYKCSTIIDLLKWYDNSCRNGRSRYAGRGIHGKKIFDRANNPNIQWDLIKNFTNQVNLFDQEVRNVADIYKEGEITKSITIQFRGRSRKLKDAYLEEYGYDCQLCGKSYLKADGASHIIDIHHLKPIACGERLTDIHKDLKGLCPNCHRFVHSIKGFENKSWDEIEKVFKNVNNK
jgi:5-methylcytosine-specific restriction endonuclease McrA